MTVFGRTAHAIGLRLVTEAQTHCEVLMRFPVVSNEKPGIEFARRQARIARNDTELRRASAQIRDLRRRVPETLKEQRPAIAFDGRDRREDRLQRGVENLIVVCVQNRSEAAAKSERSRKVLRCNVVVGWAVDPHAKSPAVLSSEYPGRSPGAPRRR